MRLSAERLALPSNLSASKAPRSNCARSFVSHLTLQRSRLACLAFTPTATGISVFQPPSEIFSFFVKTLFGVAHAAEDVKIILMMMVKQPPCSLRGQNKYSIGVFSLTNEVSVPSVTSSRCQVPERKKSVNGNFYVAGIV